VSTSAVLSPQAFWEKVHSIPRALDAGEKRWHPYELHSAVLADAKRLEDPIATYRELLRTEPDRYWREVLLFLAGWSDDPAADSLLLEALDDPELRPRALYLLGVTGTKGWPSRTRDEERILAALRRFAGDRGTYVDVVHAVELRVGDLASAAFARIVGPERLRVVAELPAVDARWIGLALPQFTARVSEQLAAEVLTTHRPAPASGRRRR
jgi:hypothetical protein